jgi:hypothetical protein
MHEQLKKLIREREFSKLGMELAAAAMPWPGHPGRQLVPDETKAYCRFEICYAWPVRTAYGAAFHPGTLANSRDSMLHQVFNRGHKMKANAAAEDRDATRDENFGAIVGVDYPAAPLGGWKINSPGAPHYEAAAVMHKMVSFVPKLLGEHLGGRHKWAVSQEVLYSLEDSGFIIEPDGKQSRGTQEILDKYTPAEFKAAGLAYVPVMLSAEEMCPEDLFQCYSFEQRRVVRDWHGQRVSVCKGGINGSVHFAGVGMVRYGAEREAQIQQLLAHDPDAIEGEVDLTLPWDALKNVSDISKKMLTDIASVVLPQS